MEETFGIENLGNFCKDFLGGKLKGTAIPSDEAEKEARANEKDEEEDDESAVVTLTSDNFEQAIQGKNAMVSLILRINRFSLFCSVLFSSVPFRSVPFCSVLFCSVLFY